MADNIQRVQIILETLLKGEDKITAMAMGYGELSKKFSSYSRSMVAKAMQQEKAMRSLANKNQFLSTWSERLGVNTARVSQIMDQAGIKFDEVGNAVDLTGKPVKDLNKVMRLGEITTRRFNMTLLSTMFAGMALQRSMSRLLQPAAEATGLFDVFSDILITTFMPIMEVITPIFERLADWMDSWGEGTKKVVGAIVLLGFGLGMILALSGQLGLAWGGLSAQIGTLIILLQGLTASYATSGTAAIVAGTKAQVAFAPFLPILYGIVLVIGAILLIWYKWEEIVDGFNNTLKNFGKVVRMTVTSAVLFFGWLGDKISGFGEGFKSVFTDIWDWIVGIWEKITTWLSDTWDNIKQFFKEKWNGMINWFKGLWQGAKDWFWGILSGIGSFFKNIWEGISTWFSEKLNNIGTWFKEKWTSIKTWFSEHLNSVFQFFKNIWNGIHNWLSEKLNLISTFFSNIWTGIKNTASDIWEGIKNTIKNAINGIIGFINQLINAWNRLSFTVPTVRVGKYTFGGWEVGVPRIPNIPLLQEGGIVRKPTMAMIGERGPEAVVPLGKGYGQTINFSPTYNITVSDKYEFEKMIKFNNTKLVDDLRRLTDT